VTARDPRQRPPQPLEQHNATPAIKERALRWLAMRCHPVTTNRTDPWQLGPLNEPAIAQIMDIESSKKITGLLAVCVQSPSMP
jgi:hypothetical protein